MSAGVHSCSKTPVVTGFLVQRTFIAVHRRKRSMAPRLAPRRGQIPRFWVAPVRDVASQRASVDAHIREPWASCETTAGVKGTTN